MLEHAGLRQHIGCQQAERLAIGVRAMAGNVRSGTDKLHVQKLPARGTETFADPRGESRIVGLVDDKSQLPVDIAPWRHFDGGIGFAHRTGVGRGDEQDLNRGGPHPLNPRRHASASVEHDEVGMVVEGSQFGNESTERADVHVGHLLAKSRAGDKLQALRDWFENFDSRACAVKDFADAGVVGDFE